jgi:DNA-binding beta-propeller fold protein YncE
MRREDQVRRAAGRLIAAATATTAAAALLAGCGLNQDGVTPPRDELFFPAGMEVDPGGRWLYVINSNSDLRFNAGTLAALDLTQVERDRSSEWPECPNIGYIHRSTSPESFCCWDALDNQVLNCDAPAYIREESTVRIGSFAGALVVQDLGGDARRLLAAVRGDTSITVVDATVPAGGGDITLSCNDSTTAPFAECDQAHKVTRVTHDPVTATAEERANAVLLPEEPYALAMDATLKLLYVGHLKGGAVSLLALPEPPERPRLIAPFPSIFPPDALGQRGVTALTVKAEGFQGQIFVSSRYLPRVGSMEPIGLTPDAPLSNQNFALVSSGNVFSTGLGGTEVRGIQFVLNGTRAFVLQRNPPALISFDLVTDEDGTRHVPTDVIETCNSPTFLHLHYLAGVTPMLFVTCFDAAQIYVVDPLAVRLASVIEVGRGPAGLAFSPAAPARAYVVGFGSNNVSVIDLDPASPQLFRVIHRIGFPSPVPR